MTLPDRECWPDVGGMSRCAVRDAELSQQLLLQSPSCWHWVRCGCLLQRGIERPVRCRREDPFDRDANDFGPSGQHPIARVVHVTGKVVRAIDPLAPHKKWMWLPRSTSFPGRSCRTVGEDSLAILQFADESVFTVAGGTELKCTVVREQKCIAVTAGDLMAQVSSQPKGKPMVIETPVANAEVLGTKLSLFASGF